MARFNATESSNKESDAMEIATEGAGGEEGGNHCSSSVREEGEDASSLPWVEKYRPKDLSELIAHEDIINILNKLIQSNKLPHLLFHGPPGTGKTSTIKACARKMFGENFSSMTL